MAAPLPSIRVVLDTRGQKKAKGFCLLLLASDPLRIFSEEKKEREVCMFFFLGNHYHQAKFSNLKITAIFQEIYVKLDHQKTSSIFIEFTTIYAHFLTF